MHSWLKLLKESQCYQYQDRKQIDLCQHGSCIDPYKLLHDHPFYDLLKQ